MERVGLVHGGSWKLILHLDEVHTRAPVLSGRMDNETQATLSGKFNCLDIGLRNLRKVWSDFSVSKLPDADLGFSQLPNFAVLVDGNLGETEEISENNVRVSEG